MASTYKMPVALPIPHQKCLQMLPSVSWDGAGGSKITPSWEPLVVKESPVIKISSRLRASDLFHFVGYLSVCALGLDHSFSSCVAGHKLPYLSISVPLVSLTSVSERHRERPLVYGWASGRHGLNVGGSPPLPPTAPPTALPQNWGVQNQAICITNSLVVCFQFLPPM